MPVVACARCGACFVPPLKDFQSKIFPRFSWFRAIIVFTRWILRGRREYAEDGAESGFCSGSGLGNGRTRICDTIADAGAAASRESAGAAADGEDVDGRALWHERRARARRLRLDDVARLRGPYGERRTEDRAFPCRRAQSGRAAGDFGQHGRERARIGRAAGRQGRHRSCGAGRLRSQDARESDAPLHRRAEGIRSHFRGDACARPQALDAQEARRSRPPDGLGAGSRSRSLSRRARARQGNCDRTRHGQRDVGYGRSRCGDQCVLLCTERRDPWPFEAGRHDCRHDVLSAQCRGVCR